MFLLFSSEVICIVFHLVPFPGISEPPPMSLLHSPNSIPGEREERLLYFISFFGAFVTLFAFARFPP